MNTPSEILRKHEDANEMHFHEVDRKFIIEAMEEYAKEKSENPINLESNQTAVQWLVENVTISSVTPYKGLNIDSVIEQAKHIEKEQIIKAYTNGSPEFFDMAEEYYNQTYNKNKQ